jgi:hypothetical protein
LLTVLKLKETDEAGTPVPGVRLNYTAWRARAGGGRSGTGSMAPASDAHGLTTIQWVHRQSGAAPAERRTVELRTEPGELLPDPAEIVLGSGEGQVW